MVKKTSYWDPKFKYKKNKNNKNKITASTLQYNPNAPILGPREEVRIYDKNMVLIDTIPAQK